MKSSGERESPRIKTYQVIKKSHWGAIYQHGQVLLHYYEL